MKHGIVRQAIVETASHLFYTNGYNRTGINEIIKEAGIAKATLYNHFKSKDDICVAYLQHKNALFVEDLKDFIQNDSKNTSNVLGLFDFLEKFYNGKEFNGCWCINTVAEIPVEKDLIRNEIQQQKEQLLRYIDALVEEDCLDKSLSKQIYLLYEGAVAESHLHRNVWPIHTAKELCSIIILK